MANSKRTRGELTRIPDPRQAVGVPVAEGVVQPPQPKKGRPYALDEMKKREICALVSAGSGIGRAAQYVGCAPSTIRRAARRDPEFDQRIRDAELHAELEPLRALRKAAATHRREDAWYLERVESQRFARRPAESIRPETIIDVLDELREVIAEEIADDETHDRVVDAVLKLTRRWEREAVATEPTTTRK